MKDITEILKGILEGCVLEIINQEETYGYEITRRLNQLGFTEVVEGTVYTILVRLEKSGLVKIQKKLSKMYRTNLISQKFVKTYHRLGQSFVHC